MPPWYVDSRGPAVKGGFALTPLESDKLLTWTTGGTPEGDPERNLTQLRRSLLDRVPELDGRVHPRPVDAAERGARKSTKAQSRL